MKSPPFMVLSDAEIRLIHQRSLEILEYTGIRVNVKKMREVELLKKIHIVEQKQESLNNTRVKTTHTKYD